MAEDSWRASLVRHRRAVALTQAALAARAGVSLAALKAYEQGARDPSRAALVALIEALKLGLMDRNALLLAAGFAPDGALLAPANPDYYFSVAEAREYMEERPWPMALIAETMEVIWANRLLQRIWGVDLDHELNSPVERNILAVITMPRFEGRLVNWDEAVTLGLGVMKSNLRGFEGQPEGSSPYFTAVMNHFLNGVPTLVAKLYDLWDKAPILTPRVRWNFPITWRDPEVGLMRFDVLVNTANMPDALSFWDLIPVDAATHTALGSLRSGPPLRPVRV